MHFTVDAFRSTPPFDILAKLFGQPEHTDWLDESLSWKQTCYIGDWSFLPQTRFRGPGVLYGDGPHPTFMDMPRDLRGHLWMDRVECDSVLVGTATSRGYSYYFRKMLSLAVLNVAEAEIGTQVDVVWGNPGDPVKRIRATVAKAPFKRVRSRAELHAHLAAYRAGSGPAA
ncbi:glycine cleavage T C-terminal barrel domain-containing protein [Streptomyces sp. NPDC050121]|uniref:glycine cleavage T C-terminal barrel domain-containing protein n=1 Tax=Streptomyces sp. NPDC050121 TaxID=3365601 RepID=UPI0037A90603